MRSPYRILSYCGTVAAAAFSLAACSSSGSNGSLPATQSQAPLHSQSYDSDGFPNQLNVFPTTLSARPICQVQADNTSSQCHVNQNPAFVPLWNPSLTPAQIPGLQPQQLAQQYGYNPSSGGAGQTVAVVVAYDESKNLPSDLATYRTAFGMSQCTVANHCLTFLPQNWNIHKPDPHSLWPTEAAIDVEMVSAVCPNCNIMVAEASDPHIANMAGMDDAAVNGGATEVSNSWSLPESPGAVTYASHFNHPGVPITAGAGGYGVGFPADLATVIGVGGTTLNFANHQESVWPLTGSGCSAFVAKPKFQSDAGCPNRTVNDVSIVGDPATGVAVYAQNAQGWVVLGGTSVGAPMIAAMYALQGNGRQVNDATSIYRQANAVNGIQSGSNGTCSPSYLCTADGGYSGPTGVGTPRGTAAF